MKNEIWVLTRSVNEYNQEGDYLEAVFVNKPTKKDLFLYFYKGSGINGDYTKEQIRFINHVLNGGGRVEFEDNWFHLSKLNSGQEYQHKY